MNREFGLRTCRPHDPGETDYRHCNDDVIRNCTAPCIGEDRSRTNTTTRVEQACDFLEGDSKDTRRDLKPRWSKAAERLDFETRRPACATWSTI